MEFAIQATDGGNGARCGQLALANATVRTPAFMPCASLGVLRACDSSDLEGAGVQMVCCNAFHLWQQPGHEVVRNIGGLHAMMDWGGGILTDSGGYQVFSLAEPADVSDEGVRFRSPKDGSQLLLTPELSIRIQNGLGSDVAMVFDECVDHDAEYDHVAESVERTLNWAREGKAAHTNGNQALFGIVQGGMYPKLRQLSAEKTVEVGFDGYAIGGVSVGEAKEQMLQMVELCTALLPDDAPRYAMGVGTPLDIVECVMRGVDMFDCVLPTRMARHGSLLTDTGTIRIKNAQYRTDTRPLDDACDCPACQRYSRAYLHHLLRIQEATAWRLLSLHNIRFYMRLMERIRAAIAEGSLQEMASQINAWTERDRVHRDNQDE